MVEGLVFDSNRTTTVVAAAVTAAAVDIGDNGKHQVHAKLLYFHKHIKWFGLIDFQFWRSPEKNWLSFRFDSVIIKNRLFNFFFYRSGSLSARCYLLSWQYNWQNVCKQQNLYLSAPPLPTFSAPAFRWCCCRWFAVSVCIIYSLLDHFLL